MNYELTPEQEARLDYIVNTTGCSYDDARRSMGLPVEDPRIIKQLMKNLGSTRGIGDKAVKVSSAVTVVGISILERSVRT